MPSLSSSYQAKILIFYKCNLRIYFPLVSLSFMTYCYINTFYCSLFKVKGSWVSFNRLVSISCPIISSSTSILHGIPFYLHQFVVFSLPVTIIVLHRFVPLEKHSMEEAYYSSIFYSSLISVLSLYSISIIITFSSSKFHSNIPILSSIKRINNHNFFLCGKIYSSIYSQP